MYDIYMYEIYKEIKSIYNNSSSQMKWIFKENIFFNLFSHASYRLSVGYYLSKLTGWDQFLNGHPTSIMLADTEDQTIGRKIKQFLGKQ